MKVEYKWCATSIPQEKQAGEELVDIAENWYTGIQVTITNPFEYTTGPIQTPVIHEEYIDIKPNSR